MLSSVEHETGCITSRPCLLIYNFYEPEQGPEQATVSVSAPTQSVFSGSGLPQVRFRVDVPGPQLLEQLSHVDQSDQPKLTRNKYNDSFADELLYHYYLHYVQ